MWNFVFLNNYSEFSFIDDEYIIYWSLFLKEDLLVFIFYFSWHVVQENLERDRAFRKEILREDT